MQPTYRFQLLKRQRRYERRLAGWGVYFYKEPFYPIPFRIERASSGSAIDMPTLLELQLSTYSLEQVFQVFPKHHIVR